MWIFHGIFHSINISAHFPSLFSGSQLKASTTNEWKIRFSIEFSTKESSLKSLRTDKKKTTTIRNFIFRGKIVRDWKKMKNKRLKDHIGKDGKLKFRDWKVPFISSPQATWGSSMFILLQVLLPPSPYWISLEDFPLRLFTFSESTSVIRLKIFSRFSF